MPYFRAGSKEDEEIEEKISQFGVKVKNKKTPSKEISDSDKDQKSDQEDLEQEEEDTEETTEEQDEEKHQTKKGFLSKIFMKNKNKDQEDPKELFNSKSKKFKKVFGLVFLFGIIVGLVIIFKINSIAGSISTQRGSLFGGWFGDLDAMADGQVNIVVAGMRGQNIPGGSLLADSIMVVAIRPQENRAALISIPRDLYVEIPGKNYSRKINEVYPIGEGEEEGGGLKLMKEAVSDVTGLPIHYGVATNFNALREIVDVLDGITVHLEKPFYEGEQFVEGQECGGEFSLPAGDVNLDGEEALCYSRARFASSDFDRARRQQQVLLAIKSKAISKGTLSDFGKVNEMISVVGNNIKTDMKMGEIEKLYDIFKKMENPEITRMVLDNSKDGLLYSGNNGSYILLPKGDNFDRIHQQCRTIFEQNLDEEENGDDQSQ
ncbi:MAG: hypothetical protein GF335_03195 [Candidatus Moranbacteria bacterium]|nr:hypothetical protein [Candidatus Moranbacteria bacterium]